MMEEGRDFATPPRRSDVAKWIVAAEKNMPSEIIMNAWNRSGLEYFPKTAAVPVTPPGYNDGQDGDIMHDDGHNRNIIDVVGV